MKLTLGFSPCPNDTFIFDALVNNLIPSGELDFDVRLEDVETLNKWALEGRLDITKLSYGVLPFVLTDYAVMNSGSALGRGVGPLLICSSNLESLIVDEQLIAIPGEHTTAHLLFSLAYPKAKNKVFVRYDEVESFVLEGRGIGVIIHENRFTYRQKGLHCITDLGKHWEQSTGNPIPLGGIVIRRNLEPKLAHEVDKLIRKSIRFSFLRHPELSEYIRCHAQEMSEDVMRQHIQLYVNDYSLDLGETGRNAVHKLIDVCRNVHGLTDQGLPVFIHQ